MTKEVEEHEAVDREEMLGAEKDEEKKPGFRD